MRLLVTFRTDKESWRRATGRGTGEKQMVLQKTGKFQKKKEKTKNRSGMQKPSMSLSNGSAWSTDKRYI